MSITKDTLKRIRAMRAAVDVAVTDLTDAQAKAWAASWATLEPLWLDLAAELATGEQWPSRARVLAALRASRALTQTAEALAKLCGDSSADIEKVASKLAAAMDMWQRRIVASQLPADMILRGWAPPKDAALSAIVRRTAGRVESALDPLPRRQAEALQRTLVRGVILGENPRRAASLLVKRLGGDFHGGLRRAQIITRTELIDACREAARESRTGNQDVVAGWRWMCSLSARTCPACLAKHGELHAADDPGPDDHQCGRCTGVPVTRTWRELGIDVDEPADTFPDAREWFDRQPAATQLNIMGAERLRRLNAGELDWSAMAELRTSPEWRDSWGIAPLSRKTREARIAYGRPEVPPWDIQSHLLKEHLPLPNPPSLPHGAVVIPAPIPMGPEIRTERTKS